MSNAGGRYKRDGGGKRYLCGLYNIKQDSNVCKEAIDKERPRKLYIPSQVKTSVSSV